MPSKVQRTSFHSIKSKAIPVCTLLVSMAIPAPDVGLSALAMLPAIALSLREGNAFACESASLQLRDLVTKAPSDAATAVSVAVASSGEIVDAAFLHALGRMDLSQAAQHALVLTMKTLYMKAHDECTCPSSAMMLGSPVFLPILQRIIAQEQPVSACRYGAIRSISRFVYGIHGKANAQLLSIELPIVLARVVDTDTDVDNRTCAMNCLNNIAAYLPSLVIAGNEAVACALRVIQEQGTDMAAWVMSTATGFTLMNRAVDFLHATSCSADGALRLRLMNAQLVLLPISSLPNTDEHHTANMALFCLINIMGSREASKKGQDSPIMLIRPDVVSVVLTDFENILDPSRRYLSSNMVSEVIRACLVLSESDSNKPHLRNSNLLRLAADTMRFFAHNAPRMTVLSSNGLHRDIGGGGSDLTSAQLCMELLLQLSFCFPNQIDWRSAVMQQCPDLNQVLLAVKDLPPNRSLDMHAMLSLKHLLTSLDQSAPSLVTPVSSNSASIRKHAMISYCWGSKKELVVELVANLKAKGVDVWRDEEGSRCLPALCGSTDDCMAEAIEHSHTIIICVSRAYKASANCRMEAKYANDMHKRGKVKLVFAMMDQDYTTRSSPEYVDGWLGLMIGDQLWHGMWEANQVAAVAAAIHGSIGHAFHAAAIDSAAASTEIAPPSSQTTAFAVTHELARSSAARSSAQLFSQILQPFEKSCPPTVSLKRPADLPMHANSPSAKSACLPPPASIAAALSAADAVNTLSLRPQPLSPVLSQLQTPPDATVTGNSAAALTVAFQCLQDANKARDSIALAALLHSLGVTCESDLAFIDDAAILSIQALLKPAAADFFAFRIGHAVHASKMECFSYLLDTSKHIDHIAMSNLLLQLGVSQPHELQYLNCSQLRSIVALLKPVAAKVFMHMMSTLLMID